jgi:hypothetical protein
MGAKRIKDASLETYERGELVFFLAKPHNLAVLSAENVAARVGAMNAVLKAMPELELCCLNSRESFEDNKAFLRGRRAAEDCESVRTLCGKDVDFLNEIESAPNGERLGGEGAELSAPREFLAALRFRKAKAEEIETQSNRMEKLLLDNGFDARRAEKADIMRLLAVYYEQDVTHSQYYDLDGGEYAEKILDIS